MALLPFRSGFGLISLVIRRYALFSHRFAYFRVHRNRRMAVSSSLFCHAVFVAGLGACMGSGSGFFLNNESNILMTTPLSLHKIAVINEYASACAVPKGKQQVINSVKRHIRRVANAVRKKYALHFRGELFRC
jgi:hypothetical protein